MDRIRVKINKVKDYFEDKSFSMVLAETLSALVIHQETQIALLQIDILKSRLTEFDLKLSISDEALDFVVNDGFDKNYGARPLKRSIQQLIENPLAQKILAGDFVKNAQIKIEIIDEGVVFK